MRNSDVTSHFSLWLGNIKMKKMKVKTNIKAGTGLGDCIAKITHAPGADEVAKTYQQTTGKSCGCAMRQEMLNKIMSNVPFT